MSPVVYASHSVERKSLSIGKSRRGEESRSHCVDEGSDGNGESKIISGSLLIAFGVGICGLGVFAGCGILHLSDSLSDEKRLGGFAICWSLESRFLVDNIGTQNPRFSHTLTTRCAHKPFDKPSSSVLLASSSRCCSSISFLGTRINALTNRSYLVCKSSGCSGGYSGGRSSFMRGWSGVDGR